MARSSDNRTPNVFLSYRREDTGEFALWLGGRLKRDLGLENVFLDVRDVFGGDDWRRTIADRIAASDVVIALIGMWWAGPRPDGTCRIFDNSDVVRWELEYALRLRPAHVVPTMLAGAQLPSVLPPGLRPLYRSQRLDLQPVDSPTRYAELLADVFMKTHHRRGRPIIVTDGSDAAEVYLDRFAHQLKNGELGLPGVLAVTRVTRGFAAVTLRTAAARWPDVIVLRHPDADDAKLAGLVRGVRRNTPQVIEAAVFGGAAGMSFALGASVVAPPAIAPVPAISPPLSPPPAAKAAAAVAHRTRNARAVSRRLRRFTAAKIGTATAVGVAIATSIVVAAQAPHLQLAGAWQVSDFTYRETGGVDSSVGLAGGRMALHPEAGCSGEPCAQVVTDGPALLRGVVIRPDDDGNRFTGGPVHVQRSCGGARVPDDHLSTSLTATRGESGDRIVFVITVAMPEKWRACPPATTRYEATATRVGPP